MHVHTDRSPSQLNLLWCLLLKLLTTSFRSIHVSLSNGLARKRVSEDVSCVEKTAKSLESSSGEPDGTRPTFPQKSEILPRASAESNVLVHLKQHPDTEQVTAKYVALVEIISTFPKANSASKPINRSTDCARLSIGVMLNDGVIKGHQTS